MKFKILYAWQKMQDAKKARLAGLFDGFAHGRANLKTSWLGRLDSNQRMAEPKTAALPLGDAPVS